MSKMKQPFDSYLKSNYSNKGQEHTHTRIGDTALNIKGGVYTVSDLTEFYSKYIKHVFDDGKFEFLTEKQQPDAGPIAVDFDFRYDIAIEDKQHTSDHITDMIDLYYQEIKLLLDIPSSTIIPVFMFEKEHVNMLDEITKDGIHMIIGIHMDRTLQILLRNKILIKLKTIWHDLPLENTWDEVLDEGITKGTTNWQLYGSRKPGNEQYVLKEYYDLEIDDNDCCLHINDVKKFDLKKRFGELTVQYKYHQSFDMLDSIRDEYEEIKKSKKSRAKKNKLKIVDRNKPINIYEVTNKQEIDDLVEHFIANIDLKDYFIKEIHLYTMCLNEEYYNPYDKWIRVGWALKNTDDSLFITWMAFSAKSNKFEYDKISDFYDMWCRFDKSNDDGLTKRSILYWAKLNNYTEYQNIRQETIDYFVEKTIEHDTDFDFAQVLYQMYKDNFTCVSIKRDIWYIYLKHKWEENEGGTNLRMAISKELHNIYFNKMIEISTYLGSGSIDSTSDKRTALENKCKKITMICNNLKRRGIKDNIMREAKEIFYDSEFIDKVDANPRLLCFNNGVLDFETKEFRAGKPDDYLSKSTKINYVKLDQHKHKQHISEINDFMNKLFPEAELRTYMWEHLASTLIGENNDQTFNIYNGNGSNGKSKMVELMASCLGDYKATVPITLIASKRTTIGSTSSEVAQLKGIRYAVMQEPSKGDRINEGIMKEITGGDPLQARALFKDSITFIPQFKLAVCTNTLLDVGSNDEGTWRRICVCEFKSKFCAKEDFDDNREYQFELDKKLGEKFTSWSPIFISMLVEKAYQTNGLVKLCASVKASSSNYRNTQDYYSEFVSDKVKKSSGDKIKETSLYEVFKNWYQLHHGKNVPKGRELFEYMNKQFGKKVRGVWNGVSIIYDDYDPTLDEDYDA
jgi:P4 family phage/plasmid primase-like protien